MGLYSVSMVIHSVAKNPLIKRSHPISFCASYRERRRGSRLDRSGILNCSQSEIHRCSVCRMMVDALRRLQVIVMARNKFSRHDFASGWWHLSICWNVSRVSWQCGHWLSIHWCPPVTDFLACVASWS